MMDQLHDSYICWSRGTQLCEQMGQILFTHTDGEEEPCVCKCHGGR